MVSVGEILKKIPHWLGITTPKWVHQAIARRNMPIMAVLAASAILYAAMLLFFLITRTPSSLDGFDAAAYKTDQTAMVFTIATVSTVIVMAACVAFAVVYIRKKLVRPGIATAVTFVFSYVLVMLWVVACSGQDPQRQIMFFASMQFLVAGLIIFNPIVSIAYFTVSYVRFGAMLSLNGQLTGKMPGDLAYLAFLCVLINVVIYGLFVRVTEREHDIVNLSQRDELTGAKNRHALRADFAKYYGNELFVMLCDIDDFKHYNDDFDHTIGDNLLRNFYYALREGFGDECVYRYGGDEFLVVSVEFGSAEFQQKVKKVADQLAEIDVEGNDRKLTYSGGYMRGVVNGNDDFRVMLHQADENLLEAKRCGKNQLVGDRIE